MNVSKPRDSDHPILIIFVIGGVTASEVRQIKETVSAAKSHIQESDVRLYYILVCQIWSLVLCKTCKSHYFLT